MRGYIMSSKVLLDIVDPNPVYDPTGSTVGIVIIVVLVIAAVVAGILIAKKSKKKDK